MSSRAATRHRNPTTTTNTSKKPGNGQKTQPPSPFHPAPPNLAPILDLLDTEKVYIMHLDTFPYQFKRKIFAVPVLLNLTIAALLFWRALRAGPTYVGMFYAVMGTLRGERQQAGGTSWLGFAATVVTRILMMLIDSILLRVILPWPVTFFFEGPANPCTWRWNVGFADTEAVVRVSRGWGTEDLLGKGKAKRGDESPFWRTRVAPAVDEGLLKGKTGYALMGQDWDLEFRLMVAVTGLVREGKLAWEDLRAVVLAWDDANGWVAWRVGGGDEDAEEGVGAPSATASAGLQEEEERKMMEGFRDRLVGMGKEDLFYRWVELMQYESSWEGALLTPEGQAAAVGRVKALFEQHGVDYGGFVAGVGGAGG